MIRFKYVLALAATLALAACYPATTSHPIGTTMGAKSDLALLGDWKGKDHDGRPSYIHILAAPNGSNFAVLIPSSGHASDIMLVTLTSVRFGGFGYMNAKLAIEAGRPAPDQPPGTVPVLYRVDPKGTLTLALMDEKAVKDAVTAHRLKGTIEKGQFGDVTITEDPAALDKFMTSPAGRKLFVEPFFTGRRLD